MDDSNHCLQFFIRTFFYGNTINETKMLITKNTGKFDLEIKVPISKPENPVDQKSSLIRTWTGLYI